MQEDGNTHKKPQNPKTNKLSFINILGEIMYSTDGIKSRKL